MPRHQPHFAAIRGGYGELWRSLHGDRLPHSPQTRRTRWFQLMLVLHARPRRRSGVQCARVSRCREFASGPREFGVSLVGEWWVCHSRACGFQLRFQAAHVAI